MLYTLDDRLQHDDEGRYVMPKDYEEIEETVVVEVTRVRFDANAWKGLVIGLAVALAAVAALAIAWPK